ncbi:phage baseplate assembly protein domain-containing protein [Acetobacter fallax]|uniref:Bacteriophage Mu Gp45 N-terminal domain-containing protein n=1 Tax=Acetobacter fallax TaxID=1737473 RepID=A0ABX0KBI3_9PROT|nr:phage baseplate assembly protein [Acetobacter fallax]NHO33335.1 hypothetical protein [Acetobacter fallax]NHO36956.1 hypothetical protein [Acetobacter fallax]
MSDHLWMALRAHTVRAVIHAIDDTGAEQAVDLTAHYGSPRTKVPVHYPFGFASSVPLDGAVTHVVATGGDQADLVALPPANPSVARVGPLAEGEAVLYDSVGQKVYLSGGRIVRVDAHTSMDVRIGGKMVFQVTAGGAAVTGSLSVSGDVAVQGNVTSQKDVVASGISLTKHVHGGVQGGSSTTGAPQD